METGLGAVVEDVSYYHGNSCDNLIDSLRGGCEYNRYLDMAALVISCAKGDDDY